jgi:hypothetical protein
MGTDIHVVPELSFYPTGHQSWHPLLAPVIAMPVERNYALFRRLAGVRDNGNGVEPIAPNRGFPTDVSPETRASLQDLHSITWLTLDEARLAYAVSGNWEHLVEYIDGIYLCPKIRFVIGFDC